MPVKIGFQVVSSTGEDEKFRSTELNYHGPTVRGWRSPMNCPFPQEIVLQLKVLAILHQIQILAHQYLIPQKIEICTSSRLDCDIPSENLTDTFEYLGYITFSDNKATGFRSRELKSILIPSKKAKFVKLRIHNNHENVKNLYNQVGLMAVNILGTELYCTTEDNEMNNNFGFPPTSNVSSMTYSSHYISPYDDLAFEMYVDQETAKIIKMIEYKKLQAVFEERFEYANTLKITLENLRAAGEILGLYEQEKKQAINREDYDKAKLKKAQIDKLRKTVYTALHIDELLDSDDYAGEYDFNSNAETKTSLPNEDIYTTIPENGFHEGPPLKTKSNSYISDNNNMSDYDGSPQKGKMSSLSYSKSQTSFTDHRDAVSPAFKTQAFSTSKSNPHLHRYAQDALSTKSESHSQPNPNRERRKQNHKSGSAADKSVDNISTQMEYVSTSSSASDFSESSPPKSVDKCDGRESLLPVRDVKIQTRGADGSDVNSVYRNESFYSASPPGSSIGKNRLRKSMSEQFKSRSRSLTTSVTRNTFDAYEERMLPALRSYHGNEVVRECQITLDQQPKSTLNEREKKQAVLPISVFGIEMVEKFYSKNFSDKEEGLKELQQELKRYAAYTEEEGTKKPPFNKIARAAIFLLHRTLRDKVYSVYSCAAETVRMFFSEYVPKRVSPAEVTRSVEKLLPELLTKSGDVTPRIHNMAAHTLLSMAECEEVRSLNIIPTHLSRPLTSTVHPRLALSRLEMVEQLILSKGISKDKRSGLTCRTLAEFGSSGLHHPAEPVRKVSERILIQVYKVNPRIVRKQLPPDDNVTRRNLLYRHLFQEFDLMDMQRKMNEQTMEDSMTTPSNSSNKFATQESQNQPRTDCVSNGNGYTLSTFQDQLKSKENKVVASQLKAIQNMFNLNEKDRNGESKKSPAKTLGVRFENIEGSQREDAGKKGSEAGSNNTSTLNILNRTSQNVEILKFPSLTDSIETTKARLLFNNKKPSKLKKVDYVSQYRNPAGSNDRKSNRSLPQNENKREGGTQSSLSSSIPVARKTLLTTYGKKPERSLNKITKDDMMHRSRLSSRFLSKMPNEENGKLLEAAVKKLTDDNQQRSREPSEEGGKRVNEKSSKIQVVMGTSKISDSMLASIRENEFSQSLLNSEVEGDRTLKKCIFCLSLKRWTSETSLNSHYFEECPMLTTCKYCMELIEISGFTNHLLVDCNHRQLFQKCEKCQEAVLRDLFDCHECMTSSTKIQKSRCPFCHTDIGDEDSSWRQHLMGSNVCQNHPRQTQSVLLC